MAQLFVTPFSFAEDNAGRPLPFAKWYFYATGTLNPVTVYADAALTTPLTNPVQADSAGRFPAIYFDGSAGYRAVLMANATPPLPMGTAIKDIDPANIILDASAFPSSNSSLASIVTKLRYIGSYPASVYRSLMDKLRDRVSVKDWGAVGDGVTDDYAAIMAAHNNAPDGATIYVRGALRFTQPLIFTRRLNWICEGPNDYFKPDGLTTSQDCITITGTAATSPMRCVINLYNSSFNSCRHGIVLQNYNNSEITANVAVGGVGYSIVSRGCLLTRFNLTSSVNYTNPLGSPYVCANHLKVERYNSISNNANDYYVRFEGRDNGIIIDDQSNEGNSFFRGTIEGLTGSPIQATGCIGLKFTELHLEGNAGNASFTSCAGLSLENVLNVASGPIDLIGCIGAYINNYTGGLTISIGCVGTRIGVMRKATVNDVLVDNSNSTEMLQSIALPSGSDVMDGGAGTSPLENLFYNPFCDLFDAGVGAAPNGFTIASGSVVKEVGTVYPGNPKGVAAFVTSTATTLANGLRISPKADISVSEERWYSVLVWAYIQAGQPNISVTLFNGSTYLGGKVVTTKTAWVPVRISARVPAGNVPVISIVGISGSTIVAGNFIVGGVAMNYGIVAPKYLFDSSRREMHYPTSIAFQPSFIGQEALAGGSWYKATGTSAPTDWKLIS